MSECKVCGIKLADGFMCCKTHEDEIHRAVMALKGAIDVENFVLGYGSAYKKYAGVAQLAGSAPCKGEDAGSSPATPTKYYF